MRFILKRQIATPVGTTETLWETLDLEVPQLEHALARRDTKGCCESVECVGVESQPPAESRDE